MLSAFRWLVPGYSLPDDAKRHIRTVPPLIQSQALFHGTMGLSFHVQISEYRTTVRSPQSSENRLQISETPGGGNGTRMSCRSITAIIISGLGLRNIALTGIFSRPNGRALYWTFYFRTSYNSPTGG